MAIRRIGEVKPIILSDDVIEEGEATITLLEDAQKILEACKGYSHLLMVTFSNRTNKTTVRVAKVISYRDKAIHVKVDLKDQADVLHIQPYDVFKDSVYSATTPQDLLSLPRNEALKAMLKAGESFHGELCPGVAIGVRMLYRAMVELGCEPRDKELKAFVAVKACVADGIQAAMGATNKRFRSSEQIDGTATFTYREKIVRIKLSDSRRFHDVEEVFKAKDEDIIAEVDKFTTPSSEPSP